MFKIEVFAAAIIKKQREILQNRIVDNDLFGVKHTVLVRSVSRELLEASVKASFASKAALNSDINYRSVGVFQKMPCRFKTQH